MKKRSDGRYVKKITMPDGSIKYLYSSAKSEREAIKDFNKQIVLLDEKKRKSYKFEAVALEWKDWYREKHSDVNFRKSVKSSFDKVYEYFAGYDINEVTAADVNSFLEYLKQLNFSYKTVSSNKSVLNMILNFAIGKRKITVNPVKGAAIPSNLKRTKRKLPSDDVLRVINENHRGFDFLPYFLLNTGLRMSEALPLEVDKDIDFKEMTITVNKHLIHDGNKPVIEAVTKTEDSARTVILLDRVAEKIPKKKGLLFCNEDGTPLTKKQLSWRWKKYQKDHNIEVTAHQLRHGYATMLFEADVSEKDAQELMGHSDITLTRQIYTHIREKRKKQTAEKLNKFNF